jgi:hypothetical protein
MVRQNITEGQPGLPLTLEVDFIDIETCEPVPVRIADAHGGTGY